MTGIEPERPLQFGNGGGKIFRRQQGAAQDNKRGGQARIERDGFPRFGQRAFTSPARDQRLTKVTRASAPPRPSASKERKSRAA